MTNTSIDNTTNLDDLIITAANTLNWKEIKTKEEATRAVVGRALTLQDMLRDEGTVKSILDSVRIYAQIDDIHFEETSQRYVIKFTAMKGDGEPEIIRTPRMDTEAGRLIKPAIDKAAPGKMALIYKHNEPAPEGAKGRSVPSSGYRVCPWIRIFA